MSNIVDPSDFEQSDEAATPHEHEQGEMRWVEVNRLLDEIMKNVESVRKIMKSVELSK